jgi:hypothetical protein
MTRRLRRKFSMVGSGEDAGWWSHGEEAIYLNAPSKCAQRSFLIMLRPGSALGDMGDFVTLL